MKIMRAIVGDINNMTDDELAHYGMPRRSGRYPWGSGEDPYQHSIDFLGRYEEYKKNGLSEKEIANAFKVSIDELRTQKSICVNERNAYRIKTAQRLAEKESLGPTEIGKRMGVSESTVRGWLKKDDTKVTAARKTADALKKIIDEKGMIDVGRGVERELNISESKMKAAIKLLEQDGYPVYGGRFDQVTNKGKKTTMMVACPPGTEHKDIFDLKNVHSLKEYISRDGGETLEQKFHYPGSLDSKRLSIRYKEEGGFEKDGVIELRRGVDDLSLGNSKYSQVRIMVDGTHYLKGMAVYADDLPDGVDVRFNTNKTKGTPLTDVLKKIKDDPENPFGANIKPTEKGGQYWYEDKKTGEKKLGLINKTREEGDWSDWKDKVPSQFLSKQPIKLAQRQIDLALQEKQAEYDSIMQLTNPTVKRNLLNSFANDCDSASVHLAAAALPGQKYYVILPVNSLKDNEVFAPKYPDGSKLALIRYPHAGTFEIPICTVNNKNANARKMIGLDAVDAIGVTSNVAGRLSGADFDGDTVMCIPTHGRNGIQIKSTDPLLGLANYEPKDLYSAASKKEDSNGVTHYYNADGKEYRIMRNTGNEMGRISNLISDMTIKGAQPDELARAVRHSMVVIDAEKHHLDYKRSEIDNNIKELRDKYQEGGASTLLSRAKGQVSVVKRQGEARVNLKGKPWYDPSRPEGALIYKTADDAEYTYTKAYKNGSTKTITKVRKQQSTNMEETDDARTLISTYDTAMENLYADYANTLKGMANKARVSAATTGRIVYDRGAAKEYKTQVDSLKAKLNDSLLNAPREREAQRLANIKIEAIKQDNPDIKNDKLKTAAQRALTSYRSQIGAARREIEITDKEWEAIQKGAVSDTTLDKILKRADMDKVRERATPRTKNTISDSKIARIEAMRSNYSIAEIAKALGISASTVSNYLKGVK